MTAVGMGLRPGDFVRLRSSPGAVGIARLSRFVVFPLLAFVLAGAFALPPALAIGLVLLAASPSASTSTVFTDFARGDVALSLTLTAVSKAVPILTLPLYVGLAVRAFGAEGTPLSVSFADTSERVVLTVLLPVAAGMAVRTAFPAATAGIRRVLMRAAIAMLALLIGALAFREREALPGMVMAAGLPAASLCLLGAAFAFAAATLGRLTPGQRSAVTIETAMQSGGTSIAIAAGLLGSPAMAVPAAVYSLVMYAVAALFAVTARAL